MRVQFSTFLFDADNTLYDFDDAELSAMTAVFSRHQLAYEERLRERYREINVLLWQAYERGEISTQEIMVARWVQLFAENEIIVHDVQALSDGYLAELARGTKLIGGAQEICEKITAAGGIIHIITNGDYAVQMARLRNSATSRHISQIFISSEVGYQKPDARFFSHVLENISEKDRAKMLVVGDSLTADIAGGNAAGIATCWFNPHGAENSTNFIPTYVIENLRELERFL